MYFIIAHGTYCAKQKLSAYLYCTLPHRLCVFLYLKMPKTVYLVITNIIQLIETHTHTPPHPRTFIHTLYATVNSWEV